MPLRVDRVRDQLLTRLGRAGHAPPDTIHAEIDAPTAFDIAHQANMRRAARVLVAEDNRVNQRVILGILKRLGYRADVVENGRAAVETLKLNEYDLVLMDVQMPEMDGLEATRMIRESDTTRLNHNTPIVAMTAYAMAQDRERCIAAGMNDYLSKPVQKDALETALKRWLPTSVMGNTRRA